MRHDHTTPPATDHTTSTEVWTEQRIRALGLITDVPTAGAVFGLGRAMSYELVRLGQFPVLVIRVGARYKVPVAGILTTLGLPASGDLTGPAKPSVDHHDEISSPRRRHNIPDTGQGAP